MTAWRLASAVCSAVMPYLSRTSVLAPAASSACTHPVWPCKAATIRAVTPSAFCRSRLALCSSSTLIMACWPTPAATMRAVLSSGPPRRSTLAPRCSSSFATRSCPPATATRSSPRPSSSRASMCPPFCSHSTTGCSSPCAAARPISGGSGTGSGSAEGGTAEASPASCRFAGLSSTASASPSTATAYRPLAASKRPAMPHRPLSSGRAWRPPMRTRRPERLGVGAAVVAGAEAACCRSSSAMGAWPLASATCSAVSPPLSRSSVLAPAASSSCTHFCWPL
eukprot:scaffold13667_cov68-Phaeocystis_antarctica.AAC.12